jgi:hypothetical protein
LHRKGVGRQRPASGGTPYGSENLKRNAGRSFLLHVEASAGEGTTKKTTVAEIDADDQAQRR